MLGERKSQKFTMPVFCIVDTVHVPSGLLVSTYRVLQSITEYSRVLQSITEYNRVLQIITEYHRVLKSITNRLQSITEYYRVL